ncbi:glutathione transferase [Pseudoduganella aquatica]|uniref:Glutathione transferase n=1 Tax=Pseudoduganella aquatica TaxID=2660641 RepID=A0A7X4KKE8_9BURK|nr:glutathione transferase [Pseudoduganella aquatica]MYN05938.1 glutathione transferase [Pseudoduganella aquatica]
MSLTLYVDSQFTSPYALSVFVTLKEKGLPFELKTVDLDAGANLVPPFRDLALTARVPALVHNGFVLTESSAISEYLDEVFPAPEYHAVLPRNAQRRALARQVQAWLRSDLMPIRQERSTITVFYEPATQPLSPAARAAADKLVRAASKLVDGPSLFTRWCVADTDLAVMLMRLIKSGDEVPQKLKDYAEAQWQRAPVQEWLALVPKK